MSYLLLDFATHLNEGARSTYEYYTESLIKQYDKIKRKIRALENYSLEQFILNMLPQYRNLNYYASMPGFDRTPEEQRGRSIIRNIIVRLDRSITEYYLPNEYDLILIGDVVLRRPYSIEIKGIDIMDRNIVKAGEKPITAYTICAFNMKTVELSQGSKQFPNFGNVNFNESYLNEDFFTDFDSNYYPVSDPIKANRIFSEWNNYIEFRQYYLKKQSERCEVINSVEVCDSYMMGKDQYKGHDDYKSLLLDNVEKFGEGEQIILNSNVNNSLTSFPLIKIVIEKNRNELNQKLVGFNKKPEAEVRLLRYTNETMSISEAKPKYNDDGSIKNANEMHQYNLGERYLFSSRDQEPDCSELEKAFDRNLKKAISNIENKYEAIINSELKEFESKKNEELKKHSDEEFLRYKDKLNNSLDSDVLENKDDAVNNIYLEAIEAAKKPLRENLNREKNKYNKSIEKINGSKLSNKEKKARLNELKAQYDAIAENLEAEINTAGNDISLRDFYIKRNDKKLANKEASLAIELQKVLEKEKNRKRQELELQYLDEKKAEENNTEKELKDKLEEEKAIKIKLETIRIYSIYYKPDAQDITYTQLQKEVPDYEKYYLTYDNRAEKAKIDRQKKALDSIMHGYVKNPYLVSYLLEPDKLIGGTNSFDEDLDWQLESLNDTQKLAVKKALASQSIFLLQGPPGTGKTQVIAEITAQLTKQGKKVLISSETHKAIDNVFDRLPKIPEIRPLRLIPSTNNKTSSYSPENLVDNFYLNIRKSLNKEIFRYENIEETKKNFDEKMNELKQRYSNLEALEKEVKEIKNQLNELDNKINAAKTKKSQLNASIEADAIIIDDYDFVIRMIKSLELNAVTTYSQYLKELTSLIMAEISKYPCLSDINENKIQDLKQIDLATIRDEIINKFSDEDKNRLEARKIEIKSRLQELRDPDTDDNPEEGDINYPEYKELRKELIDVNKKITSTDSSIDLRDTTIFKLFPSTINSNEITKLPEAINSIQIFINTEIECMCNRVTDDSSSARTKAKNLNEDVLNIENKIKELEKEKENIRKDSTLIRYDEELSNLKQEITKFFRDFNIIKEYDTKDLTQAFEIIEDEWNRLSQDFDNNREANAKKIPIFKEISEYLKQEDILEDDRREYTRRLYENANVFGITCTSRDKFTKSQLKSLEEYGIKGVDIRTQGIDVVIIDEVSKSSFLDLLIPILYGKTVILVGDHRQLPPMYDLRNLKSQDFEDLNPEIITKEKNDHYTELYEKCFFKTLFENINQDYKIMLNKQYRCHSDIMDVFNHFYGGDGNGLSVGKKQQNDEKQHNLNIRMYNKNIIEPSKHIYFIDCEKKEDKAYEGATSRINEQEANVCLKLLKAINDECMAKIRKGKLKIDQEKEIDERPSLGIICTYRDQASLISKKRKGKTFGGLSGKADEKLTINTVDEFQGDERDIIIVSMVRNPRDFERANVDFITKFERINVALSRARKMLIIVGSRRFLAEKGIIDLPDLNGNHALDKTNFHVYDEIIGTINKKGKIFTAADILGEDNGE